MTEHRGPTIGDKPIDQATLHLLTWLSPSFPIGSFVFSHGLEYAVEKQMVTDQDSLENWVQGILLFGSGRNDSIFLSTAWKAIAQGNDKLFVEILEVARAYQPTSEIASENFAQGKAFLDAINSAWSSRQISNIIKLINKTGKHIPYPIAVSVAAASYQISLRSTILAYVNAFSSNLISAGIKLIPLGQKMGLQIHSNLKNTIIGSSVFASNASLEDLGSSTNLVDLASVLHETQHTRLFRS